MVNPAFNLQLSHPGGMLANVVQGIWSAAVCQNETVEKTLYADAGSGIAFILAGDILVDDQPLSPGVIMLPLNKRADRLVMKPGSIMAGVRFQPGMGYKLFGRHYPDFTLLGQDDFSDYAFYPLFFHLQQQPDPQQQVDIIYRWAEQHMILADENTDSIDQVLACIDDSEALAELSDKIDLSQRQIERLFKTRMGMTAKNYQRIIRIRKTITLIQQNQQMSLAEVAAESGFSDQAHMTREFKSIARVTPGKL